MKQFLFLCFTLFWIQLSAQQTVTFQFKDEYGAPLKNKTISNKKFGEMLGKTDTTGNIVVKNLKSGDTVHLLLAECNFYKQDYIVPASPPRSPIEIKISCPIQSVDIPAEYPGGNAAMRKFVLDNFIYPQAAIEHGIEGKVWLRFVIDEEGNISDVKVTRPLTHCPECDREALRLIKLMPKWKPAMVKGKPAKSYYDMPLTFKMQ